MNWTVGRPVGRPLVRRAGMSAQPMSGLIHQACFTHLSPMRHTEASRTQGGIHCPAETRRLFSGQDFFLLKRPPSVSVSLQPLPVADRLIVRLHNELASGWLDFLVPVW